MAGGKWAQKIQLGGETTAGTAVAASALWRGEGGMLKDDREVVFVPEMVGKASPTTRTYIPKLAGSLSMAATPATFEQLPYILEAGIILETPAQDGAGSDYIYEYPVGYSSVNTIRTYTIETGDNQQAEEMEYSFVESFTLSGEAGSAVMMSADWIGRQVTNTTFTGAIAVPTVEEILAGEGTFYIDAATGTAGSTAVTDTLLSWSLKVDTGRKPKYTVDSGQKYFDFEYFDRDSFDAELSVVYEHNATSVAEKTDWRNETAQKLVIKVEGSNVTTAGTDYSAKTLLIEMMGKYADFEELSDEDGNSVVNATYKLGWDENDTDYPALKITVVNELSSLT